MRTDEPSPSNVDAENTEIKDPRSNAKKIKEYEIEHNLNLPRRFKKFVINDTNECQNLIRKTPDRWFHYYYINDHAKAIYFTCLCDPDKDKAKDTYICIKEGVCDCGVKEDELPEETFTRFELERMGYHLNCFLCIQGCDEKFLCIKGSRIGEIWEEINDYEYLCLCGHDDNYRYRSNL